MQDGNPPATNAAPAGRPVDILIPTCDRPAALAVTLTSLLGQSLRDFRVVISDQSESNSVYDAPEVQAALLILRIKGIESEWLRHLPRRGMAEQRQFLLDQARAPYVLFLDDDVILQPDLMERMLLTIEEQRCGFVGAGLIGPSYALEHRPDEEAPFEPWQGRVQPELVLPGSLAWRRHSLHNAANLLHLQQRLGLAEGDRLVYKVAWVGGCVLYDREKLLRCGGFDFWPLLEPEHCGEDVLAQLRVMARFGGCGLLPSGAYHQELATTLPDRRCDAPYVLAHLIAPPLPAASKART
jgi:GT2 family glycosyltransferase